MAEKPKSKILVVDDSPIVREGTRKILETFGYQVEVVSDGGQAIRTILSNSYDLILLDIEMPKVDGFQVFKRVRARDKMKTLPIIIFFTERESLKLEGLHLGASDFIVKSLAKTNTTEFQARIEAHLKIAELIQKQVEYEKLNILKAATTSACHEIFNPLTVVNTEIDLLIKQFEGKDSCQECVSSLKSAKKGIKRIHEFAEKLSRVDTTATTDYAGGGKMIDFN